MHISRFFGLNPHFCAFITIAPVCRRYLTGGHPFGRMRVSPFAPFRETGVKPTVRIMTPSDTSPPEVRDAPWMTMGRVVLIVTLFAVSALGVWIAVVTWDEANKIAVVTSALAAVAAVGVAVWAALRGARSTSSIDVSRTGDAVSTGGGRANTGFRGKARRTSSVRVRDTGRAEADGGDANTGVQAG